MRNAIGPPGVDGSPEVPSRGGRTRSGDTAVRRESCDATSSALRAIGRRLRSRRQRGCSSRRTTANGITAPGGKEARIRVGLRGNRGHRSGPQKRMGSTNGPSEVGPERQPLSAIPCAIRDPRDPCNCHNSRTSPMRELEEGISKKNDEKRLTIPGTRIHSPPAQKRVAPLNRERFMRRSVERDLSEHQAGLELANPGNRRSGIGIGGKGKG